MKKASNSFLLRLIVSLLVIMLGLGVFLVWGFNKGYEYSAHTVVTVYLGDNSYQDAKTEIKSILNEENISISACLKETNNNGENIVVIFKNPFNSMEEINSSIEERLFTGFSYDSEDDVEETYVSVVSEQADYSLMSIFVWVLLGVIVASVAGAIYVGLRFSLASAFILVGTCFHDLLLGLAVLAITRLTISALTPVVLALIGIYSLSSTIMILSRFKTTIKESLDEKISKDAIVKTSLSKYFKPLLFVTIVVVSFLLIITLFNFYNLSYLFAGIWAILAVLISSYTAFMITPYLWKITYKKVDRIKKQKNPEGEI